MSCTTSGTLRRSTGCTTDVSTGGIADSLRIDRSTRYVEDATVSGRDALRRCERQAARRLRGSVQREPQRHLVSGRTDATDPRSGRLRTLVVMTDIHTDPVAQTRTEKDPLGPLEVPADAYYGVQTQRAIRNFPISGRLPDPALVAAAVQVKKAAARANADGPAVGRSADGDHPGRGRGPGPAPTRREPAAAHDTLDRQLPRRSVPGRRRRVAQHEHQRGARQPRDRDPGRARASAAGSAAITRSSTPTTTSTWPSRRTTSSRRRCASRR